MTGSRRSRSPWMRIALRRKDRIWSHERRDHAVTAAMSDDHRALVGPVRRRGWCQRDGYGPMSGLVGFDPHRIVGRLKLDGNLGGSTVRRLRLDGDDGGVRRRSRHDRSAGAALDRQRVCGVSRWLRSCGWTPRCPQARLRVPRRTWPACRWGALSRASPYTERLLGTTSVSRIAINSTTASPAGYTRPALTSQSHKPITDGRHPAALRRHNERVAGRGSVPVRKDPARRVSTRAFPPSPVRRAARVVTLESLEGRAARTRGLLTGAGI